MSGGYFDYAQYRIREIADQIERLIETNDSTELNDWGDPVGKGYPPEIVAEFRVAVRSLRVAEVYTHRVDWLVSGDDGEESFLLRLRADLAAIEKETTQPAVAGPVEPTVRQRRLYVVRVVREAYVLADDEAEAADMQGEIERWETPAVEVSSAAEELGGWSQEQERCLVYHNGSGDITLAQARRDFPAA